MSAAIKNIADLNRIKENYNRQLKKYKYQVLVCSGAGCISSNCGLVRDAVIDEVNKNGLQDQVAVFETGCMGTCAMGPVMLILPDKIFYTELTPETAKHIIKSHIIQGVILEQYTFFDSSLLKHIPNIDDIDFFKNQVKIALRNCGSMDYKSLDAYIARDGYYAAQKAISSDRMGIIQEVKKSGLKGRGGAGFPAGIKWEAGYNAKSDVKYIVCNADEGDPGAFMDRSIIEGDPHTLIEGMIIGGYAIGAEIGYVYVRAEYPIAIERLKFAIQEAKKHGLLGCKLFGSDFVFDIEIRIGAGAFVCGEETALMSSIEGQRGEPRQKPPLPFQKGLFEKPTIINNVETLASIPVILLKGSEWYSQFGTENCKGTKVFALAGDVVNTGIIEVPMGMPLGDILFNIGGGMQNKKKFKSAQIGGPSGGCITQDNLNVSTDYDSLTKLGAIIGSGGLIAMNEDTCMVDTARFFMDFIQDESCGKCVACRLGTKRMLEILERITRGEGRLGDIELLEELGETIKETAMCGLGQTAPNPILSTIRYFRNEYNEHIHSKYCRAGVCSELFISPCENTCPANINIPGYLSLVAAGRFIDAYNLIRQENPFPAVCGRICTHPCEDKCRRGTIDEAVAICDIKRFVADYAHKNEMPFSNDLVFPKNGKTVAVIGAGASGLTCAYYLVRVGYTVDVFEAHSVAGGVLAFGIPEYRLPKKVLEHEIDLIIQSGVNIHLNTEVGKDINFKKLKSQYDSVYIATGTQFPQLVNIPGENLPGVIHGINFLKKVNLNDDVILGNTVAVIGGGNTAVDSARTALRLGASKVMMIYRRNIEAMPASDTEIHEAVTEGVEIIQLAAPVRFIAGKDGCLSKIECIKMKLGEFDKSGRRKSVEIEGSNFFLDVDNVIPAVSQYSDLPFVRKDEINVTSWGTFVVDDDTLMTTMEGVFAGGDVARGPDTVISAIADGKKAAESIDRYLGGTGKLNKGNPIDIPDKHDEDEIIAHSRFPMEMLDIEERTDSFDEVVLGYHKLNAMAEAMRCLHCDRRC
ncbi:MAG: NADH-ubiquinone oxidoreductase-F iron-sulfur binding region domain-containing protein [Oscillospiraceae bacterium]|nr:NADH-ubiquinone oxidoreductase-F iron-sulfur binding region domain-containing protein [Oscillospiraceae bacterium]MDD4413538.1 NADH-ubiquinone oxidoreductase-F iron-sulfur binding region domain-containing protein [Oscillospiraceae bacterium]